MNCGDTVAPLLQRSRDKRPVRRGKKGEILQHYFWRLERDRLFPAQKMPSRLSKLRLHSIFARLAICGQLNGGHGTAKGGEARDELVKRPTRAELGKLKLGYER
jgi:hypothetical protein